MVCTGCGADRHACRSSLQQSTPLSFSLSNLYAFWYAALCLIKQLTPPQFHLNEKCSFTTSKLLHAVLFLLWGTASVDCSCQSAPLWDFLLVPFTACLLGINFVSAYCILMLVYQGPTRAVKWSRAAHWVMHMLFIRFVLLSRAQSSIA